MIKIEADNRQLITSNKYSYLQTNYSSGVSAFSILNATDSSFATNAYILLGNFGSEDAEILKISTANNSTGAITTATATAFAHAESTRVTIVPFNQIRFYHTTDTTFVDTDPITGYVDLQPSDWFTTTTDSTNSTGYGWYKFYNSTTLVTSQESSPIPYTGYAQNTTEQILSDFFSMLNNNELKLVTREDALSWASEGYSRMKNKLNLTNIEYTASAVQALTLVVGQIEYDLPSDFDHLIFFASGINSSDPGASGGTKLNINFIPLTEAYLYNGTSPRYYIRGSKIGILPTPEKVKNYHYVYNKRATRLVLNSDEVELPNGGEYVLKDYMLYRAYKKFQNQAQSQESFESFTLGLNDMIISSVKRDANLDTWGIKREANV